MDAAWVYVIIGVVAILLIAGIVVGAIFYWRDRVQRALIGLASRREAVWASYRALEHVFSSLADADSDELTAFAFDPSSVHRKALEELNSRMRLQAEELAELRVPRNLWTSADLLCSAAGALATETGKVGKDTSPEEVLDALSKIDVPSIASALGPADCEMDRLLKEYKVGDLAVYGGGMYI